MALNLKKILYNSKINYEIEEEKITSIICNPGLVNLKKLIDAEDDLVYKGRNIGYVFNRAKDTFTFNTVREELTYCLKKYNYKVNTINKRIEDSLKMVNLKVEYLDRDPLTLSEGEQLSLSLATILTLNPKIIVLEQPTINIDNGMSNYLIKLLKKIKKYHKTIIIISSDIEFITKVSDNYLVLKKDKVVDEGKINKLINNYKCLSIAGIRNPKIIDFIDLVKKKKNIDLEYTLDIKELMKDVYRNVK